MTYREMRQYIRGIDTRKGVMQLSSMVGAGILEARQEGKTIRYHLVE
jgi:hypothetical protein